MLTAPGKINYTRCQFYVPALSGSRVMSMTERTYKHINTSLYSIRSTIMPASLGTIDISKSLCHHVERGSLPDVGLIQRFIFMSFAPLSPPKCSAALLFDLEHILLASQKTCLETVETLFPEFYTYTPIA